MKRGSNNWIYLLFFILGIIVCYISLQFKFFKINLEINVIESTIAIGTAIIGIYIAVSIQKQLTHGQNNYSFVKDKFENLWTKFNSFSEDLKSSNSLPLANMTAFTKQAYSSIDFIASIFDSFELDKRNILELELKIDELEGTLDNSISQNIIEILPIRNEVLANIKEINKCFINLLRQISTI